MCIRDRIMYRSSVDTSGLALRPIPGIGNMRGNFGIFGSLGGFIGQRRVVTRRTISGFHVAKSPAMI